MPNVGCTSQFAAVFLESPPATNEWKRQCPRSKRSSSWCTPMPNLEQCGSGIPTEKMATLMGKLMIKQWIWGYQHFQRKLVMISHLSSVLGVKIVIACPSKTDHGPCCGDRSKTNGSHMPYEWGNEHPCVQHLF